MILAISLAFMNYKLEKFWNEREEQLLKVGTEMNYKLEKFWNLKSKFDLLNLSIWTINLKSFEMLHLKLYFYFFWNEL